MVSISFPFSFQFFTRLAAEFAEEVGDFIFGIGWRCFAIITIIILRIHIHTGCDCCDLEVFHWGLILSLIHI